ncbi:MAG: C1 family peptidase [Alphaproteobacteria bacterium]|nr:C1 family peptidase [Alphaproteobacteria bacterium]
MKRLTKILWLFLVCCSYTSYGAAARVGGGGVDFSRYRSYENGCLEEVAHPEPRCITPAGTVGILALGSGIARVRTEDFPDLPPRAMIYMSGVVGQGGLGSCAAFAIVAALESLTNISFSEAELYMRAKTKGGSNRNEEGSALSEYIPLLREGIVTYSRFPRYSDFLEYILSRKKAELPLTNSTDYRISIEEFKTWCKSYGRDIPTDMRPAWNSEICSPVIERLEQTPFLLRGFFLTGVLISQTPPIAEVRQTLAPDSYYPRRFRMYPTDTYSAAHPKDPFYNLKYALSSKKTVVMSSKIYKMPEQPENEDLWDKLWSTGTSNVIDIPPRGAVYTKINHAICLCGYDDERRAFRFKNSWGTSWGDNGYAWITYDYVRVYTNSAFIIETL